MSAILRPVGEAYLDLITTLLHDLRCSDATAGLWEAADLQWWTRRDPHDDPAGAAFWLRDGHPVGAVVLTRWSAERYGCDVIGGDASIHDAQWAEVDAQLLRLQGAAVEMIVESIDAQTLAAAARAGFTPADERDVTCWLSPSDRVVAPMPDGYMLVPRSAGTGGHPMAGRNGPTVEERLRRCSLYDPSLDLAVLAADGSVAGYALFWADPVTGVGLVEPMRVEDEHAGRGVGRGLLGAGLDGLTARGCTRLKVSYDPTNVPAQRLYTAVGFRPSEQAVVLVVQASGPERPFNTGPSSG